MRLRNFGTFILGTTLLAGCNQPPPVNPVGNIQPPSLVAVSSVVNAIKCELNYTFHDPRIAQLVGTKEAGAVEGTLHLENVIVDKSTLNGGLQIGSAIKIGPTGSYTASTTGTQTADVKFKLAIDPSQPPPAQCNAGTEQVTINHGEHPFITLLQGILAEYDKIDKGSPTIQMGELDYTSQFDVERDASGGVTLDFLIFSAGQTQERDLTTTQALELDFDLSKLPPKLM